ncbi:MAG: SDR family NAD(P)-dependent oxidoreductase [Aestuariivirga sp.]|uniref:SDR family NAD(P)-dependent oxidoreductase n=1 Tax=Aestuariivirga sp. TaxID=2650926 RepID=UPI0038D22EEE
MRLNNRIAIVTGAARGIGLAIAERFAAEGASVTIADILDAEGQAAAAAIGANYTHCDVAQAADVRALVAAVVARHGAVDILVNNAGIALGGDFLDVTEADFDRVLAVNLKGSFLMLQACARQMVKQAGAGRKPGAIINMSSVNDTLTIPGIVSYCVSKGGVSQLTRATAVALAPHGIRVNAIGPGSISTDMMKGVLADRAALNRALSRTPLGRVGEPSEVASIAAFLASDDASYVTGETIYVDGGRMPLNYTVPVRE